MAIILLDEEKKLFNKLKIFIEDKNLSMVKEVIEFNLLPLSLDFYGEVIKELEKHGLLDEFNVDEANVFSKLLSYKSVFNDANVKPSVLINRVIWADQADLFNYLHSDEAFTQKIPQTVLNDAIKAAEFIKKQQSDDPEKYNSIVDINEKIDEITEYRNKNYPSVFSEIKNALKSVFSFLTKPFFSFFALVQTMFVHGVRSSKTKVASAFQKNTNANEDKVNENIIKESEHEYASINYEGSFKVPKIDDNVENVENIREYVSQVHSCFIDSAKENSVSSIDIDYTEKIKKINDLKSDWRHIIEPLINDNTDVKGFLDRMKNYCEPESFAPEPDSGTLKDEVLDRKRNNVLFNNLNESSRAEIIAKTHSIEDNIKSSDSSMRNR